MHDRPISLDYIKLTPEWVSRLGIFFNDLKNNNDNFFFSPHAVSEDALYELANKIGEDLYYLVVNGNKIFGYGLLRGWDEGYEVPSLGIAIHPAARNRGLATYLMKFLHVAAQQKGAKQIRLRVRKENRIAINLYRKLGYELIMGDVDEAYLTGVKFLATE